MFSKHFPLFYFFYLSADLSCSHLFLSASGSSFALISRSSAYPTIFFSVSLLHLQCTCSFFFFFSSILGRLVLYVDSSAKNVVPRTSRCVCTSNFLVMRDNLRAGAVTV